MLRLFRTHTAPYFSRGTALRRSTGSTDRAKEAEQQVADAPPFMLGRDWTRTANPKGWWASEKLEGIRAWWDGQRFVTRKGTVLNPPKSFSTGMPKNIILDGEIWAGRSRMYLCLQVMKPPTTTDPDLEVDKWKHLTFHVFDAPLIEKPFEGRLQEASRSISRHTGRSYSDPFLPKEILPLAPDNPSKAGSICQVVPHTKIADQVHLNTIMDTINQHGGEGVMLRKESSRYHYSQRTTDVCKLKSFHEEEALVIGYKAGKGRFEGSLGGLVVRSPDNREFSIGAGFNADIRSNPPPLGSIIQYKYHTTTTNKIPRFPSYKGVRHDLTWEQVCANYIPSERDEN